MKAQEMAMAAAREAQAAAIAAAKMAEEQAMAAAREAEKATMAGIEAGKKAAQEAQAMAVAGIEAAEGRLDGGKTSPGGEASRLGVLSLSLSLLLVCTPATGRHHYTSDNAIHRPLTTCCVVAALCIFVVATQVCATWSKAWLAS